MTFFILGVLGGVAGMAVLVFWSDRRLERQADEARGAWLAKHTESSYWRGE